MLLMIDWGNTLLKYMLIEAEGGNIDPHLFNEKQLDKEVMRLDNLSDLKSCLPKNIDLALVCSVKSDKDNQELLNLLNLHCHKVHFAKTAIQACGVLCAYNEPKFLGIDRWLSVLAAESFAKSVGVISIGTAITLDIVKNKRHLGGHIIPGKRLMTESLLNTGQVRTKLNETTQEKVLLGQSTSESVNFGIDTMILGYLLTAIKALEDTYTIEKWLICGGGGQAWGKILEQSGQDMLFRPSLVFEGLIKQYDELKS